MSIVGNTGEGKSYCLNRLFFGDFGDDDENDVTREGVFSTSPAQVSKQRQFLRHSAAKRLSVKCYIVLF